MFKFIDYQMLNALCAPCLLH